MIWFKACLRCQTGDVYIENDIYGWHVTCLACGYVKDVDSPVHGAALLKRHLPERMPLAQSA